MNPWIDIYATSSYSYPNSAKLVRDVKMTLVPALNRSLRPQTYGAAIQEFRIDYALSYAAPTSWQCNFVLLDTTEALSSTRLYARLKKMCSAQEFTIDGGWA